MRKRLNFSKFIFILSVLFFAGNNLSAQTNFIQEGIGIENISVGTSTKNDVISRYGNDFKLINHGTYSSQIIYEKRGLSFFYCHADPNEEIFVITITKPYNAITSK